MPGKEGIYPVEAAFAFRHFHRRKYGRKDFLAKVYVAFKETAETIYWLDLLYKTDYLTETQYQFCIREANELRKMLSATTKTMKSDSL